MASISINIDFGEPDGTLAEMGCDEATNAQDVIDMLKESARGRGVAKALDDWSLLDMGTVSVVFTPEIPEDVLVKSVWVSPDTPPPWTPEIAAKHVALQLWLKENQTRASWSDFGGPGE